MSENNVFGVTTDNSWLNWLLPKMLSCAQEGDQSAAPAQPINEAGYKQLWLAHVAAVLSQSHTVELPSAVVTSVLGGALASSLGQVFVAGYQGAIRQVLPTANDQQWYSLLVSEDTQDPATNPPTVALPVTGDGNSWRITGTKSWVASSHCVDQLIVSARITTDAAAMASAVQAQDSPLWFVCSSQAQGVHLSHRDAPSFLPDVSQGFARFSDLPISSRALLSAACFTGFMYAESLQVGLALVGHMWSQWQQRESLVLALQEKQEPARGFAVQAVAAIGQGTLLAKQSQTNLAQLVAWQDLLSSLVANFEARWLSNATAEGSQPGWTAEWQRDRRLVGLYAPMIRSRLAKRTLAGLS